MIQLIASDGHQFDAYRAAPAGKPRGALVVMQEIFGVNSHIRSVTDGYAAQGYLAIAPALFDRVRRNVWLGYTPEDIAAGRELKAASPADTALLDIAAAVQAGADAGKVGIVGFCWGGFLAWMAAATQPSVSCAVPYYGGGILDAADVVLRRPVMCHFGERDAMIPVDGVRKLAAKYSDQQMFIYPAEHGFNCDQRRSYDAPSAKLAQERTLQFLRQHIG